MKNLCVTIAVLFIVPFGISSCFLTSSEDESSEISSSSIAESSEELSNTNNQSSGHGAESPPSGGLSSSDEQDEGSESSDEGGEDTISSTPEDVSTGVSSGDFIEESSFEKYVGFMEQAGVCRGKPVYASHFVNFNLTVYDHDAGSDFGGGNGADQLRQGMVEDALGANGLPVFKKNFWNNKHIEEWWTEAEFPKVETTIQFVHMGDGIYSHFDNSFFPLDDESAQEGDDGLNYYFAAHMSNEFVYDGLGSRVFSFSGDDDVFVYVNGRLVIDMGGPHTSINDEFTLGEVLDAQGVKEGEIVTLDFFIAERQKSGSSVGIAMDMSCENESTEKCVNKREILCAEVLRPDPVKHYNTFGNLIDGKVVFVDYSVNSGIMGEECLSCSNDELITISGGEMVFYDGTSYRSADFAPLDSVIAGFDSESGLPIKTFYFNVEAVLDTILPLDVRKRYLEVAAVKLWNEEKDYIQEFSLGAEHHWYKGVRNVPLDSIIDLKEMGSVCTHPACL